MALNGRPGYNEGREHSPSTVATSITARATQGVTYENLIDKVTEIVIREKSDLTEEVERREFERELREELDLLVSVDPEGIAGYIAANYGINGPVGGRIDSHVSHYLSDNPQRRQKVKFVENDPSASGTQLEIAQYWDNLQGTPPGENGGS